MKAVLEVNRQTLAELLGVTAGHVTRLVSMGMPVIDGGGGRGRPGRFDAVECLAWQRARLAEDDDNPSSERDRYLAALRERVELDIAGKRGSLVSREQVVQEGRAYTKAWASMVRALPRQLRHAGVIDSAEQGAGVAAKCRELLEEISGWKTLEDTRRSAKRADGRQ